MIFAFLLVIIQLVCVLHFDGASKGNPGKAGAGAVLMTEDRRVV
jgi:ribonuclease HI